MSEPIRGKVAKILNSREVVFNIGSSDGVEEGMHFKIMDPKGENIKDPDTGEVLGSVERPKVEVVVGKVQEHLSIAATFKKNRKNYGGTMGFGEISRSLMPSKWVTEVESLKTDEQTWEDLDEEESYVKSGDPVVQVTKKTGPNNQQ